MSLLPVNDDPDEYSVEMRKASPSNLLIKIESLSLLSKHGIDKYESREFEAGDYKWTVQLYPEGDGSVGKGKYVSIYVSCVDSKRFGPAQKLYANVCIRLKNLLYHNHHYSGNYNQWFTSSNSNWGYPKFIAIDDMKGSRFLHINKGFVVKNRCSLEIEISVLAIVDIN